MPPGGAVCAPATVTVTSARASALTRNIRLGTDLRVTGTTSIVVSYSVVVGAVRTMVGGTGFEPVTTWV